MRYKEYDHGTNDRVILDLDLPIWLGWSSCMIQNSPMMVFKNFFSTYFLQKIKY